MLKKKLTSETEILQAYKDTTKEAMQAKHEEKNALEETIKKKITDRNNLDRTIRQDCSELESQRESEHVKRMQALKA